MALTLVPSPSSINRMRSMSLGSHTNMLGTCNMFYPVCVKHKKCCIGLYMASVDRHARLRHGTICSNSVSPAIHGAEVRNDITSSGPLPVDIERSDPLLDRSSSSSSNANDFEMHLQELFDEIKTLISTGKKNDALVLLEANYQAVKEQIDAGFSGIEEAAILDIIALGYMGVGDVKMVGSLLDVMDQLVDNLDDGKPILDSVLIHMASMYLSLGEPEKSKCMYQRAVKIMENLYGKRNIFLVTPLLGLAKVLGSTGKAVEAAEIYKRVISILESGRGADSADLVLPLSGLGNLLLSQGKADEAEVPFTRILDLYSKLNGENDGSVGMALCSLAHVKCAQGNSDEAIRLYKKALQIIKDSGYMALDDSIMEKMRVDLAELLHIVGRGDEGRELLEECLVITQKYKGKEHPSLATQFINLATSYSFSKNYVEAERLLRMAIRVMRKSIEPDDPSITFPMLHLAVTLFNLKRDKEAERLALEVLQIREAAFGKESLPVGEALDCLVSIQTRLGEDDEKLLQLLKRVLKIQEKEFGHEGNEVILTLNKIMFYLDKLGKKQEKLPIQRRVSVLRNKIRNRVQY